MTPRRVRLSRRQGWRMPPDTAKVDRTTKWGNPYRVGEHGVTAAECVKRFRELLDRGGFEPLRRDWRELVGRNLACWCALDAPCHADVLLEAVARLAGEEP